MIIQTGMRTDIPAFYSNWFLRRIKAGFVLVRNPYDESSVTKYSLSPKVVDVIAFCTKNPAPMLPHMDIIKEYGQYWFVTITPYGKEIEPNVPDKEKVIEDFKKLSGIVGVNSIGWRYDPVFITNKYFVEFHKKAFENMARKLSGYTNVCVISFIDLYKKVVRNFPQARSVENDEQMELARFFVSVGEKYGIKIKSCAEGTQLAPLGVDASGCMTKQSYELALGKKLSVPHKKSPRMECNCTLGNDIGAYNTCGHLCKYCYANYDADIVKRNMKLHNPLSPFLLGNSQKGDKIHEAEQVSWIDEQLTFI